MTHHEYFSHNFITDWKLLRQLGFSPEMHYNSYWDFIDFNNVETLATVSDREDDDQDLRSFYTLDQEPGFDLSESDRTEFISEYRSIPIYDIGGKRKAFYHSDRNVVAGSKTPDIEDIEEMVDFMEGDGISAYEGYNIADIDGLDENLLVSTSYDGILDEGVLGERSYTGAAEETREVVSYNVDPEEESLREEVRSRPGDSEDWEIVNSLPRDYGILADIT